MENTPTPPTGGYGKGYGKRPWWHWLILYLIIGFVVYLLIYYFYYAKAGNYLAPANQAQSQSLDSLYNQK